MTYIFYMSIWKEYNVPEIISLFVLILHKLYEIDQVMQWHEKEIIRPLIESSFLLHFNFFTMSSI